MVFKISVRTRTNGIQVGRNARSLFELIRAHGIVVIIKVHEPDAVELFEHSLSMLKCLLISCVDAIACHPPLLGTNDAESHFGLEAWLVEAREHAVAVEGLELTVQVLFVVGRVNVLVQTSPVLLVRREVFQAYDVPALLKVGHLHSYLLSLEVAVVVLLVLVYGQLTNSKSVRV